jgi:hypothetical protein
MRKELLSLLILSVFGVGIAVGVVMHSSGDSGISGDSKTASAIQHGRSHFGIHGLEDQITSSQSATGVGSAFIPSAGDLADPAVRTALEKNLRAVPYAVLKQIYLERQDQQWQHQQARYPQPNDLTDAEVERRSAALFESFQKNSPEESHYVARGEFALRGAKSVPYLSLVSYYTTNSQTPSAEPSAAANGRELCYVSTLYIRINGKYAADGQSNCLGWAAMRDDRVFAVHSNYNSKELVPFFDSLSVALPGFGAASDANSEWFDASADRWTPLGRVRFDAVPKTEFQALEKEAQTDMDGG